VGGKSADEIILGNPPAKSAARVSENRDDWTKSASGGEGEISGGAPWWRRRTSTTTSSMEEEERRC